MTFTNDTKNTFTIETGHNLNEVINALQTTHDFLRENEQYGDDWQTECDILEEIIQTIQSFHVLGIFHGKEK